MISIPTTLTTANLITHAHPEATVAYTPGRMTVQLGAVEFVADIPERRAAS